MWRGVYLRPLCTKWVSCSCGGHCVHWTNRRSHRQLSHMASKYRAHSQDGHGHGLLHVHTLLHRKQKCYRDLSHHNCVTCSRIQIQESPASWAHSATVGQLVCQELMRVPFCPHSSAHEHQEVRSPLTYDQVQGPWAYAHW